MGTMQKLKSLTRIDRDVEKFFHETTQPNEPKELLRQWIHIYKLCGEGIDLKRELIEEIENNDLDMEELDSVAYKNYNKIRNSIKYPNNDEYKFIFEKRFKFIYEVLQDVFPDIYENNIIELNDLNAIIGSKDPVDFIIDSNFDILDLYKRRIEVGTLCFKNYKSMNINIYFSEIKDSYANKNNLAVLILCRSLIEICLKELINTFGKNCDLEGLIDDAFNINRIDNKTLKALHQIRVKGNCAAHGPVIDRSDRSALHSISNTVQFIENLALQNFL